EIQTLWPTLDDHTLARMSGIGLASATRAPARKDFWKREPAPEPAVPVEVQPLPMPPPPPGSALPPAVVVPRGGGVRSTVPGRPDGSIDGAPATAPLELHVELAPGVSLVIAMPDDIALSSADVRAIRAAAAPL